MTERNKLILEGNIGCGKTTLAHKLAENIPCTHVLAENVNTSLLTLFYSDKTRYAFTLQLYMLESRCNGNLLQMQRASDKTRLFIMDRSLLGDIVFALTNYVLGKMSEAEFRSYKEMARFTTLAEIGALLSSVYGTGWRIVYLHSPFNECKERVDTVRETCEKDVLGAWYYELLEVVYCNVLLQLMPKHAPHISVVRWEQYSTEPHTVLQNMGTPRSACDTHTTVNWTSNSNDDTEQPLRVLHARMDQLGIRWLSSSVRETLFARWATTNNQNKRTIK